MCRRHGLAARSIIPGLRRGETDDAVVEETKLALLRRAAELIGRDELARRLKVPRHLLDAWMVGHATMPDRKIPLVADVLGSMDDSKK